MQYAAPIPPATNPHSPAGKRLAITLAIALAFHAALLLIPVTWHLQTAADRRPFEVTIRHIQTPVPKEKPTAQRTSPEAHKETRTRPETKPEQKAVPKPRQPKIESTQPRIDTRPEPLSAPPQAPVEGAKSRSTVFDAGLRNRLEHERNRVKKFTPPNAEYMTANGTFIQRGDYCAEIRELVPQDMDSHVTQEFKIKCTKRRRPQEDIDRLARKYGIP
ncbi:hypothetical protein [Microbulbifer hainanensis]|uniref:hypothetical protein n=1 Tax=Microbulbifer hainanensis TaxID=2735675 RepID=UPI0018668307|nr:hypothetical protein [Microbulbifer hainanensis]